MGTVCKSNTYMCKTLLKYFKCKVFDYSTTVGNFNTSLKITLIYELHE